MLTLAVFYLALPLFIFIFGYLKLVLAIPVCLALLTGLFFWFRQQSSSHLAKLNIKEEVVIGAIALVLVAISGVGEFVNSTGDWVKHYTVINDLITLKWPVYYGTTILLKDTLLTYYLGYYLVPAVIGKYIAWSWLIKFIYLYTTLGLYIGLYLVFSLFKQRRWQSLVVFLLLGGVDVFGWLIVKHVVPPLATDIEWWSGIRIQFSSFFTLLAWVPQHLLPALLLTPIIFAENIESRNNRNLIFYLMLSLFWSVFVFIGLVFIAIYFGLRKVRSLITVQNMVGVILIGLLFLYYKTNVNAGQADNGFIWQQVNLKKYGVNLLLFYLLEVNILAPLLYYIYRLDKKLKHVVLVLWICLNLIPVYKIGLANDFAMRVSIPVLFMINLLIAYRLEYVWKEKLLRYYLCIILCLALVTQVAVVIERLRSTENHRQQPTQHIKDITAGVQYYGSRSRFFYRKLAK